MPVILLFLIASALILESVLPLEIKQFLYALSLLIKSLIVFLLPALIFCLLFKAVIELSVGTGMFLLSVIGYVCCSNFIATFLSHYIGILVYELDLSPVIIYDSERNLKALFDLELPSFMSNDKAMLGALILGLICSKKFPHYTKKLTQITERYIKVIMSIFGYIIPPFMVGFIIKMQYEGVAGIIARDYAYIFILIALSQFSYISCYYLLASNFKASKLFSSIRNMIPPALSGFSTMSSAATMPLTLVAIEKNAIDKNVACSVVPITVNIHLIGDCFAIPIFAYAILKSFGIAQPSFMDYLIFNFYFVLSKFSVAAIPGGGIVVMIPILSEYMGFKGDMIAMITGLYMIFDPIITCANILGNGAFAQMIDLFFYKKSRNTIREI
jgi:Na+/H+-dicarboxylate symporter